MDELQFLELPDDLILGPGADMPVHLLALGIEKNLGGDQHDLVLFEQSLIFFIITRRTSTWSP